MDAMQVENILVVKGFSKDALSAIIEEVNKAGIPQGYVVQTLAETSQLQQELVAAKQRITELEEIAATSSQEIEDLTMAAGKASISIQAFHSQQQQLFDDFVLLRSRYDETKSTLQSALWTHCAPHHPELGHIPSETDIVDNEEQLGPYYLEELLGEGQFATVRACRPISDDDMEGDARWAIKIINKERIGSFNSLKRVSNEVRILKNMRSKYIVSIADVFQTKKTLYIVTERGGADLFEFFDEHPRGVPEAWAKEIMARLLQGVAFCHLMGICHRDLKPENILLKFNAEKGCVEDLKLCDFGLSAAFQPGKLLTEFCGSPGFFAPEMIVHGAYNGDKSDIWSTGCIMLELIMGHEQFCEIWMSSYDYDTLQDKVKFNDEIEVAVKMLPDALQCSESCIEFILKLLKIRSSERPSCSEVLEHHWFGGVGASVRANDAEDFEKELSIANERELLQASSPPVNTYMSISSARDLPRVSTPDKSARSRPSSGSTSGSGASKPQSARCISLSIPIPMSPTPDSRAVSVSPSTPSAYSARSNAADDHVDPDVLRKATLSVEPRARSVYEHEQSSGKSTFHLPPIDPPTPKVAAARKMLNKEALDSSLLTSVVEEMRPNTAGDAADTAESGTPTGSSNSNSNSISSAPGLIRTFHKGNRRSRDGLDLDPQPKRDSWDMDHMLQPFQLSTGSLRGSGATDPEYLSRSSSVGASSRGSTGSAEHSPRGKSSIEQMPALKSSPRTPRSARMNELERSLVTSQSAGNLPSQVKKPNA